MLVFGAACLVFLGFFALGSSVASSAGASPAGASFFLENAHHDCCWDDLSIALAEALWRTENMIIIIIFHAKGFWGSGVKILNFTSFLLAMPTWIL